MNLGFPLSFTDVSLWLAVTAIVLLVTSELISPYYGRTRLAVNRKRLRNTALIVSALFLVTVAMRIVSIIRSL
jgi:hypothetical protein